KVQKGTLHVIQARQPVEELLKAAELARKRNRRADREAALRQAALLEEKLLAAAPDEWRYQAGLANTLWELASSPSSSPGRILDLEQLLRRAAELYTALVKRFEDRPEHRLRLVACLKELGWVLSRTGQLDQAEGCYRQALAQRERLADQPTPATYQTALG